MNEFRFTGLCAMLLITGACTVATGELETNNRFAFPNSNVQPLGFVAAEETKTDFFWSEGVDREMYRRVMQAALEQKQGDLLIDYKMITKTTIYPLFIYTTTFRVEGTAASMDIGGQDVTAPAYKLAPDVPSAPEAAPTTPTKPKKRR